MADLIEQHYTSEAIAERILAAVRQTLPPGAPITVAALAPIDHFHGRGVQATKDMMVWLEPKKGERIIDIGAGIGGPARWIAAQFGSHVNAVDLTASFCDAARALTAATGLDALVEVVQANALALPFSDASFDKAYSQYVLMNIVDKAGFYREAFRVLKPGGRFVITCAGAGRAGPPYYPAPWSLTAETSFLATRDNIASGLKGAGFVVEQARDLTDVYLPPMLAQRDAQAKGAAQTGPPPLGVHTFRGPEMVIAGANMVRSLAEGRLAALEFVALKP